MPGGQRRIVVLTLALVLAASPAFAAPRHHRKSHKPAASGLTKAQVIALIKQYAPSAVAGAPGLVGPRGPTGPAGPTNPYTAGAGLQLSGMQFSLNPASTLFQDPLAAPQCPAYTFLYRLTQAGGSSCDYGMVGFTNQAGYIGMSTTYTPVLTATIPTAASEVLVTGQVSFEGSGSYSGADLLNCELFEGTATVPFYGVGGYLPAPISFTAAYLDVPFTAVVTNVPAFTQFQVKCAAYAGGPQPVSEDGYSTLALIPFSG